MSVGSIVDRVVPVGTWGVGIGFGESRLKDLVLGVVLGIEAGLSASMVAKAEVLDHGQLATRAALPYNGLQLLHPE